MTTPTLSFAQQSTHTNADTSAYTTRFEVLRGQENFTSWKRDLKAAAEAKNLWGLIEGTEEVPTKPTRPSRPTPPQRKTSRVETQDSSASAEVAKAEDDGFFSASRELLEDYQYKIADYKLDLSEYNEVADRSRLARALLDSSIEPSIRGCLRSTDSPKEAYKAIKEVCQMTDHHAKSMIYSKINNLTFSTTDTSSTFINKLKLHQQDLKDLDATYTDDQLITKVLECLPDRYKSFVGQWEMLAGTDSLPADVKTMHARLLNFEARLKNKKTGDGNKGNKPDKNKKSDNEKDDKEKHKCKGCGKFGTHKEEECWVKHPELKKKGQVNMVQETADDEETPKKTPKKKEPLKIVAMATVDLDALLKACNDEAQWEPAMQVELEGLNSHQSWRPPTEEYRVNRFTRNYDPVKNRDSPERSPSPKPFRFALNNKGVFRATHTQTDVEDAFTKDPINIKPSRFTLNNVLDVFHTTCRQISTENAFLKGPVDSDSLDGFCDFWELATNPEHNVSGQPFAPVSSRLLADPHPKLPISTQATSSHGCSSAREILRGQEIGEDRKIDIWDLVKPAQLQKTVMMVNSGAFHKTAWIIDSGANVCLCNDKKWFKEGSFRPLNKPIGNANDSKGMRIEGMGIVNLSLYVQGEKTADLELTSVAYVPSVRGNIISVSWLAEQSKLSGTWNAHGISICTKEGLQVGNAPLIDGLFQLQIEEESEEPITTLDLEAHEDSALLLDMPPGANPPFIVAEVDFEDPVWKWHRRLGHLGLENLRRLLTSGTGINLTEKQVKAKMGQVCPICATAKALNRVPKDPATRHWKKPGAMIYADAWGPYPIRGWNGEQYMLAFTDHATRFSWSSPYCTKDQIPDVFKALHKKIEKRFDFRIRVYRVDNEFPKFSSLTMWFEKHGVDTEITIPHTHHMNGAAERGFRTEREKAASMMQETNITNVSGRILKLLDARTKETLKETSLPEVIWPEAFRHAVWLKNRSPCRALQDKKTPWEELYAIKPDLSGEKIFGSRIYITFPVKQRKKTLLQQRGWMGYFVGFETESVMRVWHPDKKKVVRATASRVDDGAGTDDPHDDPSYSDRNRLEEIEDDELELRDDVSEASTVGNDLDSETDLTPHDETDSDDQRDQTSSVPDEIEPDEQNRQELDQDPPTPREAESEEQHDLSNIDEDDLDEVINNPFGDSDSDDNADQSPVRSKYFHIYVNMVTSPLDETADSDEGLCNDDLFSEAPPLSQTLEDHGAKEKQGKGRVPLHVTTEQAIVMEALAEEFSTVSMKIFLSLFPERKTSKTGWNLHLRHLSRMTESEKIERWADFRDTALWDDLSDRIDKASSDLGIEAHRSGPLKKVEDKILLLILMEKDLNFPARSVIFNDISSLKRIVSAQNLETYSKTLRNSGFKLPSDELEKTLRDQVEASEALQGFVQTAAAQRMRNVREQCTSCRAQTAKCNTKPCRHCTRISQRCLVQIDEHEQRIYYPEGTRPEKYQDEEVPCCFECLNRSRQLRGATVEGDGQFPCNECKELVQRRAAFTETRTRLNFYCSKQQSDGSVRRYHFSEDEHKPVEPRDNLSVNLITLDFWDEPEGEESVPSTLLATTHSHPICTLATTTADLPPEPRSRNAALKTAEADLWERAIQEEYDSLIANHTWTVVPKPPDRKVLSTRWVLKRKIGANGQVARHKARFVVRGFTQVYGLDFDETFASVVRAPSYRLLFALQAIYGWKCHQLDIKTAFLNGDVDHEIYVEAPEGYPVADGMVLKLRKALYGLKQSPRLWYEKLRAFLLDKGWRICNFDPSIFIYNHEGNYIIMCVYVDDMLIYAATDEQIEPVKKMVAEKFEISDLGPASYYLGMHVHRQENGAVHLHQATYIQQILDRFGLSEIHPTKVPMVPGLKLEKEEAEAFPAFRQQYQAKVGSLNYAAIVSRPDISESVGVVSRYNSNPGLQHMKAVDQIFAYLKGTIDLGILYEHQNPEFHAFVDADHGGCKDTGRSTTGYVLMMAGAPIAWKSKRQSTVSVSTCEAEYVAAWKASQELEWMQNLINDLELPPLRAHSAVRAHDTIRAHGTTLFIDNEGALKLSRNPELHDRTKHLRLKYHYLRELVMKGIIKTTRVETKDNLADLFTKPLSRDRFQDLRNRLGIVKANCHHQGELAVGD